MKSRMQRIIHKMQMIKKERKTIKKIRKTILKRWKSENWSETAMIPIHIALNRKKCKSPCYDFEIQKVMNRSEPTNKYGTGWWWDDGRGREVDRDRIIASLISSLCHFYWHINWALIRASMCVHCSYSICQAYRK